MTLAGNAKAEETTQIEDRRCRPYRTLAVGITILGLRCAPPQATQISPRWGSGVKYFVFLFMIYVTNHIEFGNFRVTSTGGGDPKS